MEPKRPLPERKTPNLAKGRLSIPSARYFVTCRTAESGVALHLPHVADVVLSALDALHRDEDIRCLCSTIMPDHVHLLFELGERLAVSQVVGKFKALSWRMGDVGAALAQTAAPGAVNGGRSLACGAPTSTQEERHVWQK